MFKPNSSTNAHKNAPQPTYNSTEYKSKLLEQLNKRESRNKNEESIEGEPSTDNWEPTSGFNSWEPPSSSNSLKKNDSLDRSLPKKGRPCIKRKIAHKHSQVKSDSNQDKKTKGIPDVMPKVDSNNGDTALKQFIDEDEEILENGQKHETKLIQSPKNRKSKLVTDVKPKIDSNNGDTTLKQFIDKEEEFLENRQKHVTKLIQSPKTKKSRVVTDVMPKVYLNNGDTTLKQFIDKEEEFLENRQKHETKLIQSPKTKKSKLVTDVMPKVDSNNGDTNLKQFIDKEEEILENSQKHETKLIQSPKNKISNLVSRHHAKRIEKGTIKKVSPSTKEKCNIKKGYFLPPEFFVNKCSFEDESYSDSTESDSAKLPNTTFSVKRKASKMKPSKRSDYNSSNLSYVDNNLTEGFSVDELPTEIRLPRNTESKSIRECVAHAVDLTRNCFTIKRPRMAIGFIGIPLTDDDLSEDDTSIKLDSVSRDAQVISVELPFYNYFEGAPSEQDMLENDIDLTPNNDLSKYGVFDQISVDSSRLLIILHPESRVYFHGLMMAQVLSGTVNILGYTLRTSKTIEVYSPRGSAYLYFETMGECDAVDLLNDNVFRGLNLPSDVSSKFNKLLPGSAVILCQKLHLPKITFLEKHIPQQIFPKIAESSVDCILKNSIDNWNVLRTGSAWNTLVDRVNTKSRVLICGGKSVGKSVFLRYVINKLLGRYKKILVIDLDPGQPEFTMPGCISATIVDEPVFGPNYTHLRQPYRSIFTSEVQTSLSPVSYIKAVKYLISSCDGLSNMPTLVNYMGFTRTLGFYILAAITAHVKPTTVIKIESSKKARNYSQVINYSNICEGAKMFSPEIDAIPEFSVLTIESLSDDCSGWNLEPRQIREMSILAYFGNMLIGCENSLLHKNVPIYKVDLQAIKLMSDGEILDPAAINAKIVALCTAFNSESFVCHGWGIIRSIDVEFNVCYVISPLSLDLMTSIDYFVVGAVSLPPMVHMTARHCTDIIPYIATGILDLLGNIPKRDIIPRKTN